MKFTQLLAFVAALLAQAKIAETISSKQSAIASAFSGLDGEMTASFGPNNIVQFHVTGATNVGAVKDAVARFLSLTGWEKKFDAATGTYSWYAEGTSTYVSGVRFSVTIDDDQAAGDVIVLKRESLAKVVSYEVYTRS